MKSSSRTFKIGALACLLGIAGTLRAADVVTTNLLSQALIPVAPSAASTNVPLTDFQKTLKYKLGSFSYSVAYYNETVEGVFQKFLSQCTNTRNCQDVSAKVIEWNAERNKVAAGRLEYRGKWYTDEDAPLYAMDVRAEQLMAAQEDNDLADAETAALWKSGPFHAHSPIQPLPLGDPLTYCFVGKVDHGGKPSLYIAYLCQDPDVDRLVLNEKANTPQLSRDDSIEVFLDTERSRSHYYQIILNARGDWWTAEIQNHGDGKYEIKAPWDPRPEIKTEISKATSRWMCEIYIPFDELGGVPKKGTVWGVNFARNFRGQHTGDDDDRHLQTWFDVFGEKPNLHNSERFGEFKW